MLLFRILFISRGLKVTLRDHLQFCVSVMHILPMSLWALERIFMKLGIYSYRIWASLSYVLHKLLPNVSASLWVYSLSFLGNGSVNTFKWRRIIVGGVFFCTVRIVSKESRQLILPRTWCIEYCNDNTTVLWGWMVGWLINWKVQGAVRCRTLYLKGTNLAKIELIF